MDKFHDGQYPPSPGKEGVIDLISNSEIEDSPEICEVGTLTRTKPFAGVPFGGKPPFEGEPFEGKPFGGKAFAGEPFVGKPFEVVDVEDTDDKVVDVEDSDDEVVGEPFAEVVLEPVPEVAPDFFLQTPLSLF